jgi:hypothetical protein
MYMGIFRCGLILAAVLTVSAVAQDPANPAAPVPQPLPDTNAPIIPPLTAPEIEPAVPADQITNAPVGETPKAPAKPKKKAAPKIPSLRGTASSINTTNMTVAVDVKGKEQVVKITSNTRIFADGKPAILADGKQGEKVVVEYRTAKDKTKEAVALRFGSLTPTAAAKKEKE